MQVQEKLRQCINVKSLAADLHRFSNLSLLLTMINLLLLVN